MAAISSPGVGSGLDVNSLVSQLVAAEEEPVVNRLNRNEARLLAKISGLGSLKGALSNLQAKMDKLSNVDTFQGRTATSSNTDAYTTTTTSGAAAGLYNINVTALAKTQTLVTDIATPFANTTDTIGTGSLSIRFGTGPIGSFVQNTDKGTYSITIDSSNNSLEGVRDAINSASIGVRASLINNGAGYLLSLTSEDTGAKNSLEVTVTDTGDGDNIDNLGLSRLAYNASATQMSESVAAQDSTVIIDGVTITGSTNTISGAVEGVTLGLVGVQSGTLDVANNDDGVTTEVNDFISSYNALVKTINDLTSYDPDTNTAGILNGDSGARNIATQIRRNINTVVPNLSGPFSTLAGLGITTQSDGTLKLDSAKFQTALDNNFDDIADLFAVVGRPTDSLIKYTASTLDTVEGSYDVNITALATQGLLVGSTTASLADDGSGIFTSAFVVDANNDALRISVDGVASGLINLSQNSYTTASGLAAEIKTRINADSALVGAGVSVDVSFDSTNDRFTITSKRYGSPSKVSFDFADTNMAAELGFSILLNSVDGTDVQGSIGGQAATGDGRVLTGSGNAKGLEIEIEGGVTGARGSVSFSRGVADQLNSYVNSLLDGDILTDRIDSVQKVIDGIQDDREILARRLISVEDRLRNQFAALDILISQSEATSNFLTTQLANLNTLAAGAGTK